MEQKQTTQNKAKEKPRTAGEEEIRDLMNRFAQAFSMRNLDEIMSFYAPDVVAFDIMPPLQYKGAIEFRKAWQQFVEMTVDPVKYEVQDLNVTTSGDLGVSYCLGHTTAATKSGENIDVWMRYTGVYRKINGQWKIIHEQYSVPIDMKTDKALWNLDPRKEAQH